jgi:hypothetical protein
VTIVAIPERGDDLPNLFEIAEEAAMDGLLLQRPVEALGDTIGLGLGNEGEALVDAPELDLLQEVVGGWNCWPVSTSEPTPKSPLRGDLPSRGRNTRGGPSCFGCRLAKADFR